MKTYQKLDPRLRRMARTMANPDDLRSDLERGIATSAEEAALGLTEESVTKRVLVELVARDLPPGTEGWKWSHVVDTIYTLELPLAAIPVLAELPGIKMVEAGRKWFPMLDTSVTSARIAAVHALSQAQRPRTGRGVLVGIIDYGMDFTLDDFRNADGTTRIAFLWDQSLTPQAGESNPADFAYGVEYDAAAIDDDLRATANFTTVRHRPAAASHGTHVAGIAVGNGRSGDATHPAGAFVGAAPEATIVFVQPDRPDTDGTFTDSSNVADAIAYVFAKADELDMPCVVNMSLGQNGGSHDGESLVERAIDRLLEPTRRAFVSAAGNEHVWRGHASGTLAEGDTRTLAWNVGGQMPIPGGGQTEQGPDRTANEMEIWYSSRDRFTVTLRAPDGTTFGPVETNGTLLDNQGGVRVFIDSERFSALNGDSRIYIEIDPVVTIPSGEWEVEIEAVEAASGTFDAWIERDARIRDNAFADQSYFGDSDFDSVRTLGTPATARRSIVVANFDHDDTTLNASSSHGRTRDGRDKPEIAAPGTGILAAGALGGRSDGNGDTRPLRVSKSGTSMAAPHVAGVVALLLEEEPTLSSAQIRSLLVASARPPAGSQGYDRGWGFGRLDALQALQLLRDPDQPGQASGSA